MAGVHDLMRAHETTLLQPLLDFLSARNDLRLLGPRNAENRAPTVALDLGRDPAPIAQALAAKGINAGAGDFYAVRALEGQGVNSKRGVLRLSFVHYTSVDEIDALIAALDSVL